MKLLLEDCVLTLVAAFWVGARRPSPTTGGPPTAFPSGHRRDLHIRLWGARDRSRDTS